ncbi:MAG: beta strand repeat-containing protein, partial [Saprospiraceae bacterium]
FWGGVNLGNVNSGNGQSTSLVSLSSGNGAMVIRGQTGGLNGMPGVVTQQKLKLDAAQGQIKVNGLSSTGHGTVFSYGALADYSITSSSASAPAIELIGNSSKDGSTGLDLGGFGAGNYLIQSLDASGGGITLTGSQSAATGNGINNAANAYILSKEGTIRINGESSAGMLFNGNMRIGRSASAVTITGAGVTSAVNTSSADVLIESDRFSLAGATIATKGEVVIQPRSNDFAVTPPLSNYGFSIDAASLTIGKTSSADGVSDVPVTIPNPISIDGPIKIYGSNLALNGALTASNADINLHASGNTTQTAALTANGLGLHGTGNYTLNNTSNKVVTIAGGNSTDKLGSLSFVDASGGLTIGSVNPVGITAVGDILIETLTGNIELTEPISTESSTNNVTGYSGAIVLNAGKNSLAEVGTGGNIVVSGNGDVNANNGIVKLYSGYPAGSTGLTTLVGGNDNTRYFVDETTVNFNPSLTANGEFALYRAEALCAVGVASTTPTVCINTALTPITHTTTAATGIGTATGLPSGVTANWAANTITISGTPTASGTFTYSIPLTGGCGDLSASGTITVSPANTVTAASSTPILCINTALTNITHTTTGATGIGTVSGLPAGLTATWAANTITISGTPTASGTFNYTIPLTGGCGSVNAIGNMVLTQANTAGTASASPTLCVNTALTAITHATTGATGIGTPTGLPTGVTANWASNTVTISGIPTTSGLFTYSIPLTGGCGNANAAGTIIVNARPTAAIEVTETAGLTADDGIICAGSSAVLTASGGSIYDWGGETNAIYVVSPATTTGYTVTVTASDGCTSTASKTIAVNAMPTPTLTTVDPNCPSSATGSVSASAGSGWTYLWSTDATTASIANLVQGLYTLTVTDANGCKGTSSATLTDQTLPINVGVMKTDVTCLGGDNGTISLTVSGGSTPYTYLWSNASTDATINGLPAGNYVVTVTEGGTYQCQAVHSVYIQEPEYGVQVSINRTENSGETADDGIICQDDEVALNTSAVASPGATITGYVWSDMPATTTSSLTTGTANTYTVTVTDSHGCTATASSVVTVTPDNTASAASETPTLCINTPLTAITHTTTGATGIGTATDLPTGVTATWASNTITISGTPTASGTFTYSIPLIGGCGEGYATGTITVTPDNTASAASSTPTLCINTVMPAITHTTTGATGIGTPTD